MLETLIQERTWCRVRFAKTSQDEKNSNEEDYLPLSILIPMTICRAPRVLKVSDPTQSIALLAPVARKTHAGVILQHEPSSVSR